MAEKAKGKRKGIDNLVSMADFTAEKQREIARMGGKASVEARRKKKALREICETLLALPATPEMLSKIQDSAKAIADAQGAPLTMYDAIALAQIIKATRGDTAAAQYIRDSAGDRPAERQEVTATLLTDDDKRLLERVAKRLE